MDRYEYEVMREKEEEDWRMNMYMGDEEFEWLEAIQKENREYQLENEDEYI